MRTDGDTSRSRYIAPTGLRARYRLLLALLGILLSAGVVLAVAPTASAGTPYPGASGVTQQCVASDYSCTNGGYQGSEPWGYYTTYGSIDAAGRRHNCTTYAAFRLAQNGVPKPSWSANAINWASKASATGVPVNHTPAVGAIAQWTSGGGGFGHVAYVESVDSGGIVITDDNFSTDVRYMLTHRWRIAVGSPSWPDNFLHFKDLSTGGPPAYPPVPGTGELARYNGGEHVTLTWGAPSNYRFESSLGQVYKTGAMAGTHPLYECIAGGVDNFTSPASNCEGQKMVGLLGWVYDSAQSNPPTVPVVRCTTTVGGEHFDSNDPGCEGQHVEGVIGNAIAQTSLARYNGGEHVTLTWGAPSNYRFESSLGQVYKTGAMAGTHPLYECIAGGVDNFTSPASNCEGQKMVGLLGWVYDSAQSNPPTVPVVRCTTTVGGEHFDSNDPGCEGQHVEGVIGNAIAQTSLARYNGGEHVTLTWGAPSNYRFESSLGQVYKTGAMAGTHPLYECIAGGVDNFTSPASNCEGQKMVGLLGWVYDSAQSNPPTVPVVRCTTTVGGEHFDSNDPGCEGQHVEGVIGYAIAR